MSVEQQAVLVAPCADRPVYGVLATLCMQVHHSEKKQALLDLLSVYAAGGKAIVFTRTKMGADEVAAAISQQQPCEALHGDIPQNQREKTLGRFRAGARVFPAFFSACALSPAAATS